MPALECGFVSERFLFTFGPTTYIAIGSDPDPDSGPCVPSGPHALHLALVDTGSVESCIDQDLAEGIGLPVIDQRTITSAGGPLEATRYAAQISLPELGYTLTGTFCGIPLAEHGQPHRALLGRDILRYFTMVYEGRTGQVMLTDDP